MFRRRRESGQDSEQGHEDPDKRGAWADYETSDEPGPGEGQGAQAPDTDLAEAEVGLPTGAAAGDVLPADRPDPARPVGPYDVSELADPHAGRLDLGGMLVAGVEGMELRLEVDEQSGAITAATAVLRDSALQLQPFAAPRSAGIWDAVRAEIAESIRAEGGQAEEVHGPLGIELAAKVPAPGPGGKPTLQAVRFVGADGPRWFLRGVLSGRAGSDRHAAPQLLDVFRQVVVVRGGEPMGPREPIPLRLPEQAGTEGAEEGGQRGELKPFNRGPEITEIR